MTPEKMPKTQKVAEKNVKMGREQEIPRRKYLKTRVMVATAAVKRIPPGLKS